MRQVRAQISAAVRAERIDHERRRQITRYEAGRVCEREGCDKILSRYNRGKKCWACQPEKRARVA